MEWQMKSRWQCGEVQRCKVLEVVSRHLYCTITKHHVSNRNWSMMWKSFREEYRTHVSRSRLGNIRFFILSLQSVWTDLRASLTLVLADRWVLQSFQYWQHSWIMWEDNTSKGRFSETLMITFLFNICYAFTTYAANSYEVWKWIVLE